MLNEILLARVKPSDKALYNIWARKISGGWTETTITGSLPLTFQAKGGTLTDYIVHGTAEGAGVRTENLFPMSTPVTGSKALKANGSTVPASYWFTTDYIPVSGRTFTLSPVASSSASTAICAYDANKQLIKGEAYGIVSDTPYNVTISCDSDVSYIRFCYYKKIVAKATIMLVEGTTVPENFVPYGYQIPLSITDGTNSEDYVLYIGDTQLGENEYLRFAEQKVYKDVSGTLSPTDPPLPFPAITAYQGENTLSSTETVGSVSLTGKIKEVTP